jgi:hypothetical protein
MRVTRARPLVVVALALLLVTGATPAVAELRIADLDVFLDDVQITVHVALLGILPDTFQDGLLSGLPAHVRYTVELWQYNRLWPDRRLQATVVERQVVYNLVTREFRVTSVRGESRAPLATREVGDVRRALSELRGLSLTPAARLDGAEVFYVRVSAETSLGGEATFMARLAGTAEQATRSSAYRTLTRTP